MTMSQNARLGPHELSILQALAAGRLARASSIDLPLLDMQFCS